MFRVTLRWDGLETTTSFFNYEFALSELNFLLNESKKFHDKGFIKKCSVELKKEA